MLRVLTVCIVTLLVVQGSAAQDERPLGRRPGGMESTEEQKEAREKAIAALESCDVLGVWAHPDDETFASGTFAKLAAKGKRVLLVYATSGDAGRDRTNRGLSGESLGQEREQEMRNAAKALELSTEPLFLRYPDGKVYDYWDEVIGSVRSIIAKTSPAVVITFGPDGYYGHADHIAVGQIAGRAFDDSGTPSHLLHAALSRSTNNIIVRAGGGNRFKPVDDKFITYKVDIKGHVNNRVGAMQAHKTQFDERTVAQMRQLLALTHKEEFVEVRHPGKAGLLSELLSE